MSSLLVIASAKVSKFTICSTKAPRAADHVFTVIVRQAAGWVGVHVAEGSGLAAGFLVDDGKAVYGYALRHRLVPRLGHQPAGIVAAVT